MNASKQDLLEIAEALEDTIYDVDSSFAARIIRDNVARLRYLVKESA